MPQKKVKKDRSIGAHMQNQSRKYFTGREEEISLFRETIRTLKKTEDDADIKRSFNVHGQGGIGKTTLLLEYEQICVEEKTDYLYIDAKRESGESIVDLIDLMRSMRLHFSESRFQSFTRSKPFSEFDEAYKRYKGLEEKVRQKGEKETSTQTPSGLSKIVEGVVQEGSKLIPGGQIVSTIATNKRVQEGAQELIGFTASSLREWLINAFGNANDADFFQKPEPLLVGKFSDALEELFGDKVLVLLLDTYEELDDFDTTIREDFLSKLNIRLVIILSGRHSLYDRCNLTWRSNTHFVEMKPFNKDEVVDYLLKRSYNNQDLGMAIHEFTLGLPLAVGMATDIVQLIGDEAEAIKVFKLDSTDISDSMLEERMKIIDRVVERFLSQVPENQRHYVWSAAVFARFDEERLSALNKENKFDKKAYNQVTRYSFITKLGSGYIVHDLVRIYILQSLNRRNPTEFNSLHKHAADYYLALREKSETTKADFKGSLEWRNLTLEYLYHSLQADHQAGQNILFHHLADALYEREYIYSHQLTEILKRPLQITDLDLRNLRKCCTSLENGDENQACVLLEADLATADIPPYLQYIAAFTLGHLRAGWPFNDYNKAINHFNTAHTAALKIPAQDRAALALAMLGESYGHLQKWDLATENLQKALKLANQTDNQLAAINCQIRLGRVYRSQGKLDEAIKLFKSELPQELSNHTQIRIQLIEELGLTLQEQGKYQDAIVQFEKNRDLAQKLGLFERLASTWQTLGIAYRAWGKLDKSIQCLDEAFQVNEKNRNEGVSANILRSIGFLYQVKGEYAKAISYFEQSCDKYKSLEHSSAIASLYDDLADTYRNWGKFDDAIRCYEEARGRFTTLDQTAQTAGILLGLGLTHQERGDYAHAIEFLEQSRELYIKLDRPVNIANLWAFLGVTYNEWGKFEDAIRCYEEARTRYTSLGQTAEVATILWGLGLTHRARSDYAHAIEFLEQSRELYTQLDRPVDIANLWNQLGISYRLWGKFEDAIRCYEEARTRYTALGQTAEVADIHFGLGLTHRARSDYAHAIEFLEQSRELYTQLDRPVDIASLWDSLGDTYRLWGKFEDAIRCYEEARTRYTALGQTAQTADILFGLGLTHQARGDYAHAIEFLEQSRDLYTQLDLLKDIASIWNRIGETEILRESHQIAINCFSIVLEMAEKYEFIAHKASALSGIGVCFEQTERYTDAAINFNESISLWKKLDEPDLLAKAQVGLCRLLWREGKQEETKGMIQEIISVLDERSRSRDKALLLRDLGEFFIKMGEPILAREYLESSKEIFKKQDNSFEFEKTKKLLDNI